MPGLMFDIVWIAGQRAVAIQATFPRGLRYSICARGKWKMCAKSLGGVIGTHFAVRQRSFHVHLTSTRRPVWRSSLVGGPTGWYNQKPTTGLSRDGSIHFRSASTTTVAVTVSPKNATGGVTVVRTRIGKWPPSAVWLRYGGGNGDAAAAEPASARAPSTPAAPSNTAGRTRLTGGHPES